MRWEKKTTLDVQLRNFNLGFKSCNKSLSLTKAFAGTLNSLDFWFWPIKNVNIP